MTVRKRRITLTDFEHRLLIKALVEFRNQLMEAKKSTVDIDDLILKVIDAPKYKWWR